MKREKKPLTADQALVRMADLCARSEQCPYDIVRKLRAKSLSETDVQHIIEELKRRRFLDERRFASSFARYKVRFAGWGRLKIRVALAARRIPSEVIGDSLGDIEPDDYRQAILRAARSKAASLDLSLPEERAKLARHLLSRGFEPELVNRLMSKIPR